MTNASWEMPSGNSNQEWGSSQRISDLFVDDMTRRAELSERVAAGISLWLQSSQATHVDSIARDDLGQRILQAAQAAVQLHLHR